MFNYDDSIESTREDSASGPTDAGNNHWLAVEQGEETPATIRPHVEGESSPVVRPNERRVLVLDSGVTWESLTSSHRDRTDFMFVRYEVGGSSTLEDRLIRHAGVEYGFILKGTLQIDLGFDTHVLNAGDSISFDSSRPHRLYNVGDVAVEAIWVNLEFRGN